MENQNEDLIPQIPEVQNEGISFSNSININAILNQVYAIKHEIGKVIVGQHELLDLLMVGLLADGHILLEGVPGVAKTLTAKLLAKTINVQFGRIQFTPDLMPSDVVGTNIFNPQNAKFEFRQGPIFGNIILIDEINRAPAKTQSSLFEVMEERSVTVDGTTYKMTDPFMVIATQNPVEHEGTYQLPEAQLDRFLFKLVVNYPTIDEEVKILNNHNDALNMQSRIAAIQTILSKEKLTELRALTHQVKVEEAIVRFICKIVGDTRTHNALYLGDSPRASLAILNASKAMAAISGRDFVTPDDVLRVALPALRHRISITPEKEMDGVQVDDIINEIFKNNEIPR
jgi:MoxR-like ATPase